MEKCNKISFCDCFEGMSKLPNGCVDLIVCDPPYGTIKGGGKGTDVFQKHSTEWDTVLPTEKLFAEYYRLLRNNGTLVLFSNEPYTSHLRTFRAENMPFAFGMIWEKTTTGNPLNAKRSPLSFYEDISVWRKRVDIVSDEHPLRAYSRELCAYIEKRTGCKSAAQKALQDLRGAGDAHPTRAQHFLTHSGAQFHLCTEETYEDLTIMYDLRAWEGYRDFFTLAAIDYDFERGHEQQGATFNLPDGASCVSNILRCAKDTGETLHPTQKPVALVSALVRMFSNPDELVLDNCMGSGTTAVACIRTGRRFVGFENNKTFYNRAQKRIKFEMTQTSLFY